MMNEQSEKTMPVTAGLRKFSYKLFFLACLIPVTILILKKPQYNNDILAYMAIAVSMDHKDIQDIHRLTYQAARENMPAAAYQGITHSDNGMSEKMVDSPLMLYNRLPFYVVKPLYNFAVYTAYKAGAPLPLATLVPGLLAFLLTGLLMFHWLSKYLSPFFSFSVSLLLMHAPFMVQTAAISSPDMLSAFILFCAFYFIAGKRNIILAACFLLLSAFVRMDNILTAGPILIFMCFTGPKEKRMPLKWLLLMLALLGISFFIITGMAASFGWNRYFYPSFMHYMSKGYLYKEKFSLLAYLALMLSNIVSALVFSFHLLFGLLVVLMMVRPVPFRLRKLDPDQQFALLLPAIIFLRFLVFPDLSDRFYIAFYCGIAMLFIKKYAALISAKAIATNDK